MTRFLVARKQWDTRQLVADQKPKFFHSHKELLYDLAYSKSHQGAGRIGFSRWGPRPLPDGLAESSVAVSSRPGFFDYAETAPGQAAEWHINFANNEIFSAWATSLFAQDEVQVAEHPGLIAMRLAAMKEGLSLFCVEDESPRPILVTGVERRLRIDTATNPRQGRPLGLYGNAFTRATEEQIAAATTVIEPASVTNLLAIEAPSYGSGLYTPEQIRYVLETAFAGYSAAIDESGSELGFQNAVVNTGFWGCGAYGGNRVLMLLLQMVAANLAGLSRIVFHLGDERGEPPYREALAAYEEFLRDRDSSTDALILKIAGGGYRWGESDGN